MSSSVVQINGTGRTTTYLSATQLSFQVTAADQQAAGTLALTVSNPSPGGGTSNAVTVAVNNPLPTLTSVAPASVIAGSATTTVTLTGTNFVGASAVQLNGSTRATTYVSPAQLTFQLTAADQLSTTELTVIVVNPAPGGGHSAAIGIAPNNPVPGLLSLSPALAITGTSTPTAITATGSGFLPSSTVLVGGQPRTTTYVTGTQLKFQLTVADQAATANLSVTVQNPTPAGGNSGALTLPVTPATGTPILLSASPNVFYVGSASSTITLASSGITTRSTAQWNGTPLTTVQYSTCYVQTTYYPCLKATVPASLLASVGTANVSVSTPTATPTDSNSLPVTLSYLSAPTLTSISSTAGTINSGATLTVYGSNFGSASCVALNGNAVPTTYVNASTLTATLPATMLATPGVFPITVVTPAPGGGTSAPLYYTAYVAIPNNSMVYNPANGLFYLSVPSAAGAPYGNSIVSLDPVTGALGQPIPVGSEPDRLALTADGKYLWVALDGASAVRKVDLTAGAALYQFPIDAAGASTYIVASLAALPGAPDSVIVTTYYGGYTVDTGRTMSIFDSGVARSKTISFATYAPYPWTMIVNGATQEIYGPGSVDSYAAPYITYTYDATGITLKSSTNSNILYANNNTDDSQLVGSTLYTSFGQGVNAETGALLGTFYSSGTTRAEGSIAVDTTLGEAFILDGAQNVFTYGGGASLGSATLRAFHIADYSVTADAGIPVALPLFGASYVYQGPTGDRLTRWGSDGLAYRDTGGFVSLHTKLVQDLSAVQADLSATIAPQSSTSTGANVTYTVTVMNNGPSAATNVNLVSTLPSTGVLISATSSTGSCVAATPVVCSLGTLNNGATAQIALTLQILQAGSATVTAQVSASETDPTPANNSASATSMFAGSTYNPAPALKSFSPASIAIGSADTQITVSGTGFTAASAVQVNRAAVQTTFVSSTQLTATLPAGDLSSIGWLSLAVATPSPGGGVSAATPLYVFAALPLTAQHVIYDPYTRKLLATLGAGTSKVVGNSLLPITPETGSVGTPVVLAGTPSSLAETADGQYVYALLPNATAATVARYSILNQQLDFTASGFQVTGYNVGLRDLATIPGSPNALAVDEGEYPGTSIFDFDGTKKVATRRGAATGTYTGTCLVAPDPSRLFLTDLYTSGSLLESYSISANGLLNGSYPYYQSAVLQNMNCFKVDGNFVYGQAGGVASLSGTVPIQTGTFEGMPFISNYASGVKDYAPDASLNRSFFLTAASPNLYSSIFDSVTAFDQNTYMPAGSVSLPFAAVEGTSGFTGIDVVRWGQDGLAILSSSGTLYLLRGPIVVPGLLGHSDSPSLSSSAPSLTHGSGNMLVTLTGSNFLPGVVITWNGTPRTTRFLSTTQLTVAIPASDLTVSGAATITAINPGSGSSSAITLPIQ